MARPRFPAVVLLAAIAGGLLVALPGGAWAQGGSVVLFSDFRVDLATPPSADAFEGVVEPGYKPRLSDGEAAEALLAEARWVFAAMVWGFDYLYTPSDRARSIEERFEVAPRWLEADAALLRLRVVSTRLADGVMIATVECPLGDDQAREASSWRVSGAASQARGASPYALGPPGADGLPANLGARRVAILSAAKESLRAYLRELTHNKPREVRGSFAFASAPRVALRDGAWQATVRVLARTEAIEEYGVY